MEISRQEPRTKRAKLAVDDKEAKLDRSTVEVIPSLPIIRCMRMPVFYGVEQSGQLPDKSAPFGFAQALDNGIVL